MHRYMPNALAGALIVLTIFAYTLIMVLPIYVLIIFKVLIPIRRCQRWCTLGMMAVCRVWLAMGRDILLYWTPLEVTIEDMPELSPQGNYMMVINHQSWNDIFILFMTALRQASFPRFFLKQELIWVPLLGPIWWGLDYPFMKRHSKEAIAKDPSLKGQDLDTTRKALERYKDMPVTVLNFLEGTRRTEAKHQAQKSPYKHLLKPKAGGLSFALSALGEQLDYIVDVSMYYPEGAQGFWALLSGKVNAVTVSARLLEIPETFRNGDYSNDPEFRAGFQQWVSARWEEKDELLDRLAKQ